MVKRLLLLLLTILLLITNNCFASISNEYVKSDDIDPGGAGTLTTEVTLSSVSNGYLVVFAHMSAGGANYITGVTYNGSSMTKAFNLTNDKSIIYYTPSPASGTHDIVVTHDWAYGVEMCAHYYSGVKNQAPEANNSCSGDTPTSGYDHDISCSVTTITNNAMVVSFAVSTEDIRTDSTTVFTFRTPTDGSANTYGPQDHPVGDDYINSSSGSVTSKYEVNYANGSWNIGLISLEQVTSDVRRIFTVF